MSAFEPLIGHISRLLDEQGDWSLSVDEVARLLSLDETELFGMLYRQVQHEGLRTPMTEHRYAAETAGELIRVLETLYGEESRPSAEEAFTRAGLFLPHGLRVDLQERLVRQFIADYVIHAADLATFDAMLRATGRADEAVQLYIDEHFPLEPAISRAATNFTRDNDYPQRMEATAGIYLASLFRRHILDRKELLSPLVILLRGRAADTGYIRAAGGRGGSSGDDGRGPESVELEHARSLFGIRNATTGMIRERYKALIRKYHPDINPSGLEMSKKINVAYAILLESVKQ